MVIDYNGDVRACELREKFATLADFDYDFSALWAAHERQAELALSMVGRRAGARTSVLFTTQCAIRVALCFTKFPKTI